MKLFSMSVLSIALMAPAAALACGGTKTTTAAAPAKTCGETTTAAKDDACHGVQGISVGQLAAMQKGNHAVNIFDANRDETRAKYGMVPGAKALSSYREFDVAKELPKDKNALLVFYCANTKCSAAPKAAQRAWDAGYTNVYVMRDGIMGWTEAGQPVARPSA